MQFAMQFSFWIIRKQPLGVNTGVVGRGGFIPFPGTPSSRLQLHP
ncbi:hypothetical protein OROGR_000182 [Orobanche gracilis]